MNEITGWAFAAVGWAFAAIAYFNGWRQAKRIEQNITNPIKETK